VTEPTTFQPGGPTVRAVLQLTLPVRHGWVSTPEPTTEHGGLQAVPAGTVVRLNVGDARRCYMHDARKIVGALASAAEIEVVGTDPRGVEATRAALATALDLSRLRHTG